MTAEQSTVDAQSPYLAGIAQRYATELAALPANDQQALQQLVDSTSELTLENSSETTLRTHKALFAYRWAHARLAQSVDAAELGQLQTRFAQATIDQALKLAWNQQQFAKIVPASKRLADGTVPGLFIMGLGKLGGYDLNFSSDVDLVAFYDPETLPVSSMHGRTDVCSRVLKAFTQILSKNIDGEFVWRVDWRLRPNASSMLLTMSTEVAEDFYFFHSMPWQRLAMIKARVIAGDFSAGDKFLASLEPYLWRQNLDFQMVDEIARLKEKINDEHPQLKGSRARGQLHSSDALRGYNLKLGRGGIREIEFIANALQLLWGGKKPQLRNRSTLDTLQQLAHADLLEPDNSELLQQAYLTLRLVEDAIQIIDNSQSQCVPEQDAGLQRLLALLNCSEEDLQQRLAIIREQVTAHFDQLFADHDDDYKDKEKNSHSASALTDPEWLEELPERQQAIWHDWQHGFQCYAIAPGQQQKLAPLFVTLAQMLDAPGIDREQAILSLHQFFQAVPSGGQYLRLLVEQPNVANDIFRPLLVSPHMTALLEQSPHIVDMLLEPGQHTSGHSQGFVEESQFVLQSSDFEVRLERLRRFVNEQLYALCLQLMQGQLGSKALSAQLTTLAEHTLQLGITITNQSLELDASPITIIGMGKLGMSAMAPMSDLDLIFVANPDVELEFANQYSNRLQHLMDLRTREGRAYEMDMRLRPSGRSGPVTVSLASFENYQRERAKTWEHIALSAGRPITGDAEVMEAIQTLRGEILQRPRDEQQFKLDAAKMLWRLQSQRIGQQSAEQLDVKLRRGGLMEADYLCACATIQSTLSSDIYALPYDAMLAEVLASSGSNYLPQPPSALLDAVEFWRQLQIWSRVFGLESINFDSVDPDIEQLLLNDTGHANRDALVEHIIATSNTVAQGIDNMQAEFEQNKPQDWADWNELPVKWQ